MNFPRLRDINAATAITMCIMSGCDRQPAASSPAPRQEAPAPDNTSRNARDKSGTSPTPIDQGENEKDRTIVAEIRKAIMGREGMSVNAQNCKIIARDGVVTLRGPVKSSEEKTWIEQRARTQPGVISVVNELEVTG